MSTRSRRLPRLAGTVVIAAALTTACTAQGGGGEAGGSCAIAALYEGRTYTQVDDVHFTVGEALGPVEVPPCDDTPGHDDEAVRAEPAAAFVVDGLNPRTAIAMRYAADEVLLLAVQPGGSLPPEVEALTRGQGRTGARAGGSMPQVGDG
ncbi:DUF6281 family protein [Streptomyces sp. BK208]|uniref:DUF6281 family protein n=1 Tax=Streptomyces sp. BK208 TaxID=2512150 RepID=UPI00105D531B|nr:DUF6281 family protein [Streptomyces sp. BK208]